MMTLMPETVAALSNANNASIGAHDLDDAIETISDAEQLNRLGTALLLKRRYGAAIKVFSALVQRVPAYTEAYKNLSLAFETLGETDAAAVVLAECVNQQYGSSTASNATPRAFVMFAMPKSASTFISTALARTLRRPLYTGVATCSEPGVYRDTFPKSRLVPDVFRTLVCQPGLIKCPAIGSDHNLAVLAEAGVDHVLIHIRDPRQSLLSYFHHCRAGRGYVRVCAVEPRYAEMTQEQQLGWLLRHYYPLQISWIKSWMRVADADSGPEVKLSSFSEMRDLGEVPFIRSLCSFYGAEPNQISLPEKTEKTRFRNGSTSEWREVLGNAQQALMWDMLPADMRARFSWTN